jgi:hypothetical protein
LLSRLPKVRNIFWLFLLLSCNPAKRALQQKELIDKAIAEHVLNNPIPYTELIVPGDTTIIRDTSWIPFVLFDTLYLNDTVKITIEKWREITKTLMKTDTFIRTVTNEQAIRTLMEDRARVQQRLDSAEQKAKNYLWWLIALAVSVIVAILALIKK